MEQDNIKKLAVIIPGWHYSVQFFTAISNQVKPKGWEIDYFVIGHRLPEDIEAIQEKDFVREYNGQDGLMQIDKAMYGIPLTSQHLSEMGWNFSLEENIAGDGVFTQWKARYGGDYDMYFMSHDDNYILSLNLFADVLENKIDLFKLDTKTFNPKLRECKYKLDKERTEWLFLENGWPPGRIHPRMSFGFYSNKLIEMMPDGNMDFLFKNSEARVGDKSSPKNHKDLNMWNSPAAEFGLFLIENSELLDKIAYLSITKRVSKYCFEGERGFIHHAVAGGNPKYKQNVIDVCLELGLLRRI